MRSKHAVACADGGMTARGISKLGMVAFFECSSALHSQALLAYRKFSDDCSCNPRLTTHFAPIASLVRSGLALDALKTSR
jgi:hypothetical protein